MSDRLSSPVTDVLDQLGIAVASVGAEEIAAHCPFHSDVHPSFSINSQSGLWMCHQCGARGSLPMLVEQVGGGERGSATRLLREVRYASVSPKRVVAAPEPEPVIDQFALYAQYEALALPPSWALEERQFGISVAKALGIRWDRGWVLPIWEPVVTDPPHDLRGWQFKRLEYVSNYPRSVEKGTTLFGLHCLRGSTVTLVESPLDVARLAAVGVPAVASFGAYVSRTQFRLLVEVAEQVILALDQDEEGQRQMERLYRPLAKLVPTRVVTYPDGAKDPGDLTDDEAVRIFRDF